MLGVFRGILGRTFACPSQVTKALDALLVGLSDVAKKASEELGEGATEAQIVDRTIKLFLGKYESDRINFLIFHDRVAVFSNRRFFKLFRDIEPKCTFRRPGPVKPYFELPTIFGTYKVRFCRFLSLP